MASSKFDTKTLWEERYTDATDVYDYSGRLMKKAAIGDPNSKYHPTIDHIRPLAKDGKDIEGNIEICHRETNAEKGDTFPTWKTNGKLFQAKKVKGKSGHYKIYNFEG